MGVRVWFRCSRCSVNLLSAGCLVWAEVFQVMDRLAAFYFSLWITSVLSLGSCGLFLFRVRVVSWLAF